MVAFPRRFRGRFRGRFRPFPHKFQTFSMFIPILQRLQKSTPKPQEFANFRPKAFSARAFPCATESPYYNIKGVEGARVDYERAFPSCVRVDYERAFPFCVLSFSNFNTRLLFHLCFSKACCGGSTRLLEVAGLGVCFAEAWLEF